MKQVILDLGQENVVSTSCAAGNKIIYSTEVLKSNLCDYKCLHTSKE